MIRSIIFYIILFIWTFSLGILCLPILILPKIYVRKLANLWINGIFIFLKIICGISYEIRGLENIPDKPIIVASKHQSAFETLLLFKIIKNSVFIHKRELLYPIILSIQLYHVYLTKKYWLPASQSLFFLDLYL